MCTDATTGAGFARFKPNWLFDEQFFRIRAHSDAISQFTIHLQSTPDHRREYNSTIDFYFDPNCSFDVYLQFDLKTALGKLLMHHAEGLLCYCLALVLVVIARQLADLGQLGICFTFGDSLSRSSRFFALTLLPALIEALVFLPTPPAPLAPYLSRPPPRNSALEGVVVRILLYSLALGLISLLAKIVEYLLLLCASIYIRTKKAMRQSWNDPNTVPQMNENQTSRLLTAAFVAVIALSVAVGGGIALTAAAVVHLIQVSLLRNDSNLK